MDNRRTLDKLGGGRNSLFSTISHTDSVLRFDSMTNEATRNNSKRELSLEMDIRVLMNMGMDEQIEDKLLSFKNIIIKMDKVAKE